MGKKLLALLALFLLPLVASATILGTQGGGTGSSSPSGILFGNNNATPLSTLTIGNGLTLTGSTLTSTGGSSFGYPFPGNATTTNITFSNGITGNASTATALQTGRLINGVNFDGTQNITVFAASSTLLGDNNTFSGALDKFSNTISVAALNGLVGANNGLLYGFSSTSLFGYVPLNPTRNINTTAPLTGGGNLTGDLTLGCASCSTFAYPFNGQTWGNATTSVLGLGGFISTASSTFSYLAGVAAGSFLAVDPTGKVISTSTPSGSNSAFSPAANYATTGTLPAYGYIAGVITEVGNGALSVDGANPTVGQIVLVKNENGACTSSSGACNNGLYNVTVAGSGIAAFVLTRNSNYNSSTNVIPGIITYIISGTVNNDDFYAMTAAAPITIGTTGLTYVEVSGGGAAVTSVSNSDSTLTITPTSGAVVASLNLAHANTWSVLQNFSNATSTLFSATYASSTLYFGAGLATCNTGGSSALTYDGSGRFGCNTITGSSSFSFPFTSALNFGALANATGTPIWFQAGLQASTTSYIASTTFAINGNVGISTTSPTAQFTVASKTATDQTPAFVIDGATGSFNADMQLNRGSNTGTEEANIDFATAGAVNYQLGIQNNSTSDFELWDGSNDPVFTIKSGVNNIGFGTSTPFGDFAINADYGDVLPGNLIFNVASSSLVGTTSLFSISNKGSIVTNYVTGLLHSVAGVITSSLISLTADVTGTLVAGNGGTGAASLSNAYATTTGALQSVDYKSFTVYATTTSGFTGTSTTPLGFTDGSTWNTIKCTVYGTNAAANTTGFAGVDFFWNTSHLNFIYASSTVGTTTLTTNNVLPLNQPLFVSVGTTTANTIQAVTCTVKRAL